MKLKILVLAAACATSIPHAWSQEKAPADLSLKFLCFPQQESPKTIELLIDKDKTIPIETPGNELSPTYKVKGLSSITVGVTVENDKKEKSFHVLGNAPALSSTSQIILLIRKGPDKEGGFIVIPVDGDLGKFSGGCFMFINAARMPIGGKIGDKTFALKPGQKNMLQPGPSHAGGGCQVTLSYKKDEEWKLFYDTRWSLNKRFRTLVFFYQDPESGSLGIAPIMEIL